MDYKLCSLEEVDWSLRKFDGDGEYLFIKL